MAGTETRIALVTGGIGGIGTAICKDLSREGCRVVATYVAQERDQIDDWREKRRSEGGDVALFEVDVADFDSCKKAVESVEQEVGSVEILVNCAGITRDTQLKKMSPDAWNAVIDTNLNSVFNMTRQVVNGMIARGFGRVVNISSINGMKGQFGQTNYSASKAGMHGFTMALAQEVARKGVTVNTISPGYIATQMVMAVDEKIRNQIIAQIPVGRLGKPEEIARVVSFLAAESSGFITGANIAINGGQFIS